MSSSPEAAVDQSAPVSNLTYLHKHQPKNSRHHDASLPRGRNSTRHELGRRNRPGERVTRIYPRQVYVTHSPPSPIHASLPPKTQTDARPPPQDNLACLCKAPLLNVAPHKLQCHDVPLALGHWCHAQHRRPVHHRVGQVSALLSPPGLSR